jgi:DNA ligase-1
MILTLAQLCSVTLSPVSVAAQGMICERGLSLRFPRFVRVRDDKAVENASTPVFLADMYRSQNNKKKGGADDFELVDGDLAESTVEDEGEDEDADEEQD